MPHHVSVLAPCPGDFSSASTIICDAKTRCQERGDRLNRWLPRTRNHIRGQCEACVLRIPIVSSVKSRQYISSNALHKQDRSCESRTSCCDSYPIMIRLQCCSLITPHTVAHYCLNIDSLGLGSPDAADSSFSFLKRFTWSPCKDCGMTTSIETSWSAPARPSPFSR